MRRPTAAFFKALIMRGSSRWRLPNATYGALTEPCVCKIDQGRQVLNLQWELAARSLPEAEVPQDSGLTIAPRAVGP